MICFLANKSADIALDFDREKKRLPIEFWKKKNGDRFKINSPILRQRLGLKFSRHLYLTHLNGTLMKFATRLCHRKRKIGILTNFHFIQCSHLFSTVQKLTWKLPSNSSMLTWPIRNSLDLFSAFLKNLIFLMTHVCLFAKVLTTYIISKSIYER